MVMTALPNAAEGKSLIRTNLQPIVALSLNLLTMLNYFSLPQEIIPLYFIHHTQFIPRISITLFYLDTQISLTSSSPLALGIAHQSLTGCKLICATSAWY